MNSARLQLGLVLYKIALRLNPALAAAVTTLAESMAAQMVQSGQLNAWQQAVAQRAQRQ